MAKNLQIALGVVVVLALIYLLNENRQKQYTVKETSIFNLNQDELYSFRITSPRDSITISRLDSIWKIVGVDSLNIKQQSIDTFFDKVLTVKKGTLISNNKEKWSIYSVHDTNSIHLTLLDKEVNVIGNYYIGQSKSNYANNYIRTEVDDNVYLTSENISYYLRPIATYWGEKPAEEVPVDSTSIN